MAVLVHFGVPLFGQFSSIFGRFLVDFSIFDTMARGLGLGTIANRFLSSKPLETDFWPFWAGGTTRTK